MAIDVTTLSREELEEIVIKQSDTLRILQEQVEWLKLEKDKIEESFMEMADAVMVARAALSC